MYKNFKLILFILIIFKTTIVYSENNIVFLDMNKILLESKPGSSLIKRYEKLNKENINNFLNAEKKLKDEELKIIAQKNILSQDIYRSKITVFKKKIVEYNLEKTKKINDFKNKKNKSFGKILTQINEILTEIADKKSYTLILKKDAVIVGKTELDITSDLIEAVNQKLK